MTSISAVLEDKRVYRVKTCVMGGYGLRLANAETLARLLPFPDVRPAFNVDVYFGGDMLARGEMKPWVDITSVPL